MLSYLFGCATQHDGRCEVASWSISCDHETISLGSRDVHFQVPLGEPPAGGWPVALLFQGSLFPAGMFWSSTRPGPLGADHQVELTAELLARGVAVVTPEAAGDGLTCWNTNLPPWSLDWASSPDAELMSSVFEAIDEQELGDLDPTGLRAAGISSGGYMASRVGNTWPERFSALAIVSASYQSCVGPICSVPDEPPAEHPPTLFLHGQLDTVVPIWTMYRYHDWLVEHGVAAELEVAPLGVHAWTKDAPELVADWFDADHPGRVGLR